MKMLIAILNTIRTIIKHRLILAKVGRELGVSWMQILKHDNSKFHPIEFMQYVRRFECNEFELEKWQAAWRHHYMNNPHHIEYWQDKGLTFVWNRPNEDSVDACYIPNDSGLGGGARKRNGHKSIGVWMPDMYVKEMVADWVAASYAYSGEWPKAPDWNWGNKNLVRKLMLLEHHPQPEISTRALALSILLDRNMITMEQHNEANTI